VTSPRTAAEPLPEGSWGARVVGLARRAVEGTAADPSGRDPVARVRPEEPELAALREPRGVFVTLEEHPSGRLRGCIGYPLPVFPLGIALVRAADAAAREDPRFPPVRPAELDRLTVEVSVLTVPEPILGPPEDRPHAVVVGRDGLIVETSFDSGLLLPQVAVEQGWDAEAFLAGTCEKAGAPPSAWRRASTKVRKFQAEVFREQRPRGPVVAVPLTPRA